MKPYKVELAYFKPNGTFYSSCNYETEMLELYNIWDEVKRMCKHKLLPGLCKDHSEFIVLVNVPEHKNNHPILINIKSYIAYCMEKVSEKLPLLENI